MVAIFSWIYFLSCCGDDTRVSIVASSSPSSWQNFLWDGWPITCGATLLLLILLLFAERCCVPSSDVKSYLAPFSPVWLHWGKRLSVFSFDTRGTS